MVIADTSAILELVDPEAPHHETILGVFKTQRRHWILPWAILAEVDYHLLKRHGPRAERAFVDDIAAERLRVEWGSEADLVRAGELNQQYSDLKLGLVDGVVMAVAERLNADAIATLDVRHFGAVELRGKPKLLPRDV